MNRLSFLRDRRWQLALTAAALTAVAGGAVWRAVTTRDALFERVQARLTSNVAITQSAVERWIEERRYDAATAMRQLGPTLAVASDVERSPSEHARAVVMLDTTLSALQQGHGYMAVWIVDSAGHVVGAATDEPPSPTEIETARRVIVSARPHVCDPFSAPAADLAICYATPVTGSDRAGPTGFTGRTKLAVVLRSNPAGSLFSLVTPTNTDAARERTQLVAEIGDEIVILSPTSRKGRPMSHRWPTAEAPEVIRRALAGAAVPGAWVDSRGVEVMGGARGVRGAPWAVVRQVDRESILVTHYAQLRTEGLLVAFGLALLGIGVFTATRSVRSRHQREVAASEQRLAATLRSSFDAVIAVDERARIQFFNAAAERMFRCTADDVIGTSFGRLMAHDLQPEYVARFREFVEGDAPAITLHASKFTRAVRMDGEEFRFEAAVSKGEAGGGEIYTILMRDVTERLRGESERARSLSLLLATLESTADGIIVVDRGGEVVAYNQAFLTIWRIAEELSAGHVDAALLDDACLRLRDPEGFRERVRELDASPECESFDVLAFADGRIVERIGRPQRLGDEIVGRVWSFRDVTDRERAVEALRQSEASARSFVEHSPYGICRTTPEGQVITVNPALVRMLGYDSADEMMQRPVTDFYAEPSSRPAVMVTASSSTGVGAEVPLRRRDGSVIVTHLYARAERTADGSVAYFESSIEDVTPLREAERALQQAEKLAAVGQFVSGVAHELNNPLSAVLLFAETLMQDDRAGADRETLVQVREQALRARAIVRDLLSFVRGRGTDTVRVDARDALAHIARALTPQVTALGARLETELCDALGWIEIDRAAVEQVVTNLVINAAQAAPGGTVRLVASAAGGRCNIKVEDDGPGIPADVLPRMFEPFFTTKPVGAGTGLGLSVSLGIAAQHGGTLRAENRSGAEGSGARLTLSLPLTTAPEAQPATPVAHLPPTRTGSTMPRVLLIDDEQPIRKALSLFFARRHWQVDEAADGATALDMLLAARGGDAYELVISDLRMPGVSGVMLHDHLAVNRPALLDRLVFSTGDVVSPEAAAFVARTRCTVLEKPFELSDLDAIIRQVAAHA